MLQAFMVARFWNTSGNLISLALETEISESSSPYLPKIVVLYAIADSTMGQFGLAIQKRQTRRHKFLRPAGEANPLQTLTSLGLV